jgi:pheromone a factor receptor
MIWTGLGCLMQSINSIAWNKNAVNRASVYCDICKFLDPHLLSVLSLCHPTATRIQVALNVAIPACSLCINRRLYKISTMNAVVITYGDKCRAVIQDLFVGVGIPVLQMTARKNA